MLRRKAVPPFVTPFAILSIIILIGTSNLVVNHVTHTQEGAPIRNGRVMTPTQIAQSKKAPAQNQTQNEQNQTQSPKPKSDAQNQNQHQNQESQNKVTTKTQQK